MIFVVKFFLVRNISQLPQKYVFMAQLMINNNNQKNILRMATLNLEGIKASGVYTYEYDASQSISQVNEYGRLAIGSSKTGPFNTIVSLQSDTEKKAVFGQNDKTLEKKGSYFHKSLEVLLNEGDVYALNILPIDVTPGESNTDLGYFTSFSTSPLGDGCIGGSTPICNFFNRQKFWTASSKEVIKVKNAFESINPNSNSILTFASTSQKPITIFVKRSEILGYDVTVEEWYAMLGSDYKIPDYLHKDDFVSDYMVTVIAAEGDFTNYEKLSIDPTYSAYFDKNGLIVSKINQFCQLKNVNVIIQSDGCLIPDFKDNMGRAISIDRLINNRYTTTQLICAIDGDKLDEWNGGIGEEIDLIGNELVSINAKPSLNMLSYKIPYFYKEQEFDKTHAEVRTDADTSFLFVAKTESGENKLISLIEDGILNDGDDFTVYYPSLENNGIVGIDKVTVEGTVTGYNLMLFSKVDGTILPIENTFDGFKFNFSAVTANLINNVSFNKEDYKKDGDSPELTGYFDVESTPSSLTIFFDNEEEYSRFAKKNCAPARSTSDTIASVNYSPLKVGNYIKAKINDVQGEDVHSRILKIVSINKQTVDSTSTACKLIVKVKTSTESYVDGIDVSVDINNTPSFITIVSSIPSVCKSLCGVKLSEFKLRSELLPDGTANRQDKIMKYLFESTNIASAICESELYNIRYIIDTYSGEISSNSKYNISMLAAQHGKAMSFINAPSMRQFEESSDPSFLDAYTRLVSCKYIADGGNLDINPSFSFEFAKGAVKGVPLESFTYPVFPNLIINDSGTQKSMISAPYACNAYMRKFQAGSPYSIVAGSQGKLTEQEIIGVEYELTNDDRAYLEPKGYNLIVNKRRGGVMLYTNNTGYQTVKSALNNAHVRDTLITIEKNIENILYNFLFKFNTSVVRARVKALVDDYLDGVTLAGGLAGYTTQIDKSNNTQYVLENNSAVIDITVDFNRGIHKFINKITITRVGGEVSILTSGFSAI